MREKRRWRIGTVLVVLTLCGCVGAAPGVRAEESESMSQSESPSPLLSPDVEDGVATADRAADAELVVTGRPGPKRTGSSATGRPGLDALLQLPSGYLGNGGSRPVAGASEPEWRRRFRKAAEELSAAEGALASTRRELDGVAEEGGANQWAVAPPGSSGGSGNSSSPLSFKLRQALVRDRERVEGAQKSMRELRIEADLAGVPASWRFEGGTTVESGADPFESSSPSSP